MARGQPFPMRAPVPVTDRLRRRRTPLVVVVGFNHGEGGVEKVLRVPPRVHAGSPEAAGVIKGTVSPLHGPSHLAYATVSNDAEQQAEADESEQGCRDSVPAVTGSLQTHDRDQAANGPPITEDAKT
jgi:hypothetical protein